MMFLVIIQFELECKSQTLHRLCSERALLIPLRFATSRQMWGLHAKTNSIKNNGNHLKVSRQKSMKKVDKT